MAKNNFIREILRDQLSSGIFQFITLPVISLIVGWLGYLWAKRAEILNWFYLLVDNMNISEAFKSIIGFVVPVVGFAVLVWIFASTTIFTFKKAFFKKPKFEIKNKDFSLEKDTDGAYLSEIIQRDRNMGNMRTWLVFRNGKQSLKGCRVVLENLGYLNGKTWEESYTSIERKALKWRVGYDTHDGRIDIVDGESITVDLARAVRHPIIKMELAYLDGYTGEFLLQGIYRAFLLVDVNNVVSIRYEVDFEYKTIGYLEIKEVRQVPAT